MPKLIIVRGLPGSGKSTRAKSFGAVHFESDMFFIQDSEYKWSGDRIGKAHAWCREQVKTAMLHKIDVAVSNTFTQLWEMKDYIDMAHMYKYEVKIIRCIGNFDNVHDVPNEALMRMKTRFEDYDGEEIYDPRH